MSTSGRTPKTQTELAAEREAERKKRLAEALRANLRKRKAPNAGPKDAGPKIDSAD